MADEKKKKIVIYSILFLELNVQIFVNDSRMETLWRIFISEIKRIPQSTYVRNSGLWYSKLRYQYREDTFFNRKRV